MRCCAAVITVLALSTSGCFFVDPNACNSTNCNGCCDSSGTCQGGTSTSSCGASANLCDVCVGTQLCQAGRCTSGGTGGGFGGGFGGGPAGL
jgi:hypothetical protein